MRTLFLIPIVHTYADMGSMSDALRKEGEKKLGKEGWLKNQKKIEKFWDEVEEAINKLDLNFNSVRIYQDGMPCDGELAMGIINQTAELGSKNFQIIKKLIEKGARIEITENRDLLLKEYDNVKDLIGAKTKKERYDANKKYENIKDELLKKRDKFIAERIDETLKENEIGFLFIGAHHNVKFLMPKDIQIKDLD